MKALRVELAFLDGEELLGRAKILVYDEKNSCVVESERGDTFELTFQFEEPACPLSVKCFAKDGTLDSESAMHMGVHNSEDWEVIELAEPYEMGFKCAIVDSDSPDWATQEPISQE